MSRGSASSESNDRLYPLEGVFHEAMHQWDDKVIALLRAQATADGLDQRGLSGPQLAGQPDYGWSTELGADILTEPAELARG